MNRFIPATVLIACLATTASAKIDPDPVQNESPILTPTSVERMEIEVSVDEIDACRATLSEVLGTPPLGVNARVGQTARPSLPVVQCVIEARN
jgi:hypothetical protein|tara:strand:- start:36605 stop:36883 length:279 start_codon:yes stop_codon:yes gene_type:complete